MVSSLADLIRESAEEFSARVAIIGGGRKATYAGLEDHVGALACGLAGSGLKRGDRVVLLAGNTYEFVVALFGILRAGGIAVPLNPALAGAEVEHAVSTVRPRLLIADPAHSELISDLDLAGCGVLVTGTGAWSELTSGRTTCELPGDTDPETPALLLFTAGSSGEPRAAMLSHRALLANIRALLELRDPEAISSSDVTLAVLPLSHVYSLNTILILSLAAGATVVLSERFDPAASLETIVRHRVTVVAGAPPMYVAWSAETGLREAFAGTRLALSGAAPLAPALFDQFRTVTGKPIWEGYGLTECSPVITTALASGVPKAGSVGRPLPNVEVRIVPEPAERTGRLLGGSGHAGDAADAKVPEGPGPGEIPGEIWVRGESLFSGYWPDGSDGPDAEGWFGTGDVGYFDSDGDLILVDHRSELVIVSGFNVSPREVERVIGQHPAVSGCVVFGIAHPYSGEAVKAVVSLRPDRELGSDELVAFCQQRLAGFKCPTIVEFVPELPDGASDRVAEPALGQS